jgi:hypothetical protein
MRERLSDEQLASMRAAWSASGVESIPAMLDELRARRAADLTAEEREALRWLAAGVADELASRDDWRGETKIRDGYEHALAALERLVGGGK